MKSRILIRIEEEGALFSGSAPEPCRVPSLSPVYFTEPTFSTEPKNSLTEGKAGVIISNNLILIYNKSLQNIFHPTCFHFAPRAKYSAMKPYMSPRRTALSQFGSDSSDWHSFNPSSLLWFNRLQKRNQRIHLELQSIRTLFFCHSKNISWQSHCLFLNHYYMDYFIITQQKQSAFLRRNYHYRQNGRYR